MRILEGFSSWPFVIYRFLLGAGAGAYLLGNKFAAIVALTGGIFFVRRHEKEPKRGTSALPGLV